MNQPNLLIRVNKKSKAELLQQHNHTLTGHRVHSEGTIFIQACHRQNERNMVNLSFLKPEATSKNGPAKQKPSVYVYLNLLMKTTKDRNCKGLT